MKIMAVAVQWKEINYRINQTTCSFSQLLEVLAIELSHWPAQKTVHSPGISLVQQRGAIL